jgi:drug/metabolite transporter (DMT)-like permease
MEGRGWEAVQNWPEFLLWLGALIIVAHVISFNLYGWLLTRVSITLMMFCGFLCPIFSTLFGWLFLGETITWHAFVALAGLTCGLALFNWESLRKERII